MPGKSSVSFNRGGESVSATTLAMSEDSEGSGRSWNKRGSCFNSLSRLHYFLICIALAVITIIIVILIVTLGTGKTVYIEKLPEVSLTTLVPIDLTTSDPDPDKEDPTKPWTYVRLPSSIKPVHYNLTLFPHFYPQENHFFDGEVKILIQVNDTSKFILIHKGPEINITKTQVLATGNVEKKIEEPFYSEYNAFWVIPMSEELVAGLYDVILTFNSKFADDLAAFYKSSYKVPLTNEIKTLVSSDFEPTDARRAFPCFDEPSMKAQFSITLIHKNDYVALSNMPVETTEAYNDGTYTNYNKTSFQRTVTMSTYIVCFIICEYKYKEKISARGTPVRIYVPEHKLNESDYGLDVGIASLDYFENYFNLSYTLPKLDLIMIPDFKAGAMENWGLITFREIALLYSGDPKTDFIDTRLYPGGVVAHELAHMWFGNLVTMSWWDDLWLNEGFASFASEKALSFAESGTSMALREIGDMRNVMNLDNNIWSHPIRVPVNRPEEIRAIFDSITYLKGGAVILMLESILGEDKFKEGLRYYMQEFDSSNTVTTDLWRSLAKAEPEIDVTTLMDTWTLQMGYPLVTISLDGSNFVAQQEWYLLNQTNSFNAPNSTMGYKWEIHLQHKIHPGQPNEGIGKSILKKTDGGTVKLNSSAAGANDVLVANVFSTGYYRVNYDNELWTRIHNLLNPEMTVNHPFSITERVTLVDDAFNVAKINKLNYTTVMDLISFARKDRSSEVWTFISRNFGFLESMLQDSDVQGNWRRFVIYMTQDLYNEKLLDLQDQRLRKIITDLACGANYKPCLDDMGDQFESLKNSTLSAPFNDPFWTGTILRQGIRKLDTEENWNFLWEKYVDPADTTDKNSILRALTSTGNQWLVKRLYQYAQNANLIRLQDKYRALTLIGDGSSYGNLLIFDWLNENAYPLHEGSREENLAKSVFAYYKTAWELRKATFTLQSVVDADIQKKFATHRFPNFVFDRIKFNIHWNENIGNNLRDWLRKNY